MNADQKALVILALVSSLTATLTLGSLRSALLLVILGGGWMLIVMLAALSAAMANRH